MKEYILIYPLGQFDELILYKYNLCSGVETWRCVEYTSQTYVGNWHQFLIWLQFDFTTVFFVDRMTKIQCSCEIECMI